MAAKSMTSPQAVRVDKPAIRADKWNFTGEGNGRWRWSLTSPEGEVIRSSSEAYPSRAGAVKNAKQYGYHGV